MAEVTGRILFKGFGFPEMAPKVYAEFKPLFEILYRLNDGLNSVVNAAYPEPTKTQLVILKLGELSMISMLELVTLVGNGLGQGAFKILRSMLEYGINAEYLRLYPAEVDNFINWHWVEQKKHLDYMRQSLPDVFRLIKPEDIKHAADEYTRVLPSYETEPGSGKPRSTWTTMALPDRAFKANLQEHYRLIYPLSSRLFHGSISGLVFHYEPTEDEHRLATPPSLKWCRQSLIGGHALALEMLKTLCKSFEKESTPPFTDLESDYKRVWKELRPKPEEEAGAALLDS